MNSDELNELVDNIYQIIFDKLKNENYFKSFMKIKTAQVTDSKLTNESSADETNADKIISVKFAYDTESFDALNYSGKKLVNGDYVQVAYWIDLKNAIILFKGKDVA